MGVGSQNPPAPSFLDCALETQRAGRSPSRGFWCRRERSERAWGGGERGVGGVRNPVADGRVTVPQEVSAAGFCLAWLRAACTLHRERQEGGSGSGGCWARPPPGGGGVGNSTMALGQDSERWRL